MKFTIKKDIFLEKLKLINKITASAVEKNFLLFIKIILKNNEIKLIGINNTMHICIKIKNIKNIFFNCIEGFTLIKNEHLLKIVEKISHTYLTLDVLENSIEIYEKTNNQKNYLQKLPCASEEIKENYPDISFKEFEKNISISSNSLDKAIKQIYFIALKNENNPELSSINLNVTNKTIEFTTFDNVRCAKKKIDFQEEIKEKIFFNINIPIANMLKICDIFKNEQNINISTDNKTITFKSENIIVSSNLLNKEFPIKDLKKERFITKDEEKNIKVLKIQKNEILNSLEKVLALSDEEKMVKLKLSYNQLELFSDYKETGNATVIIEKNKFSFSDNENKENFEIYFNGNYVLEAIKSLDEEIKFTFVTKNKPFIIENFDNDNIIHVIAPITE